MKNADRSNAVFPFAALAVALAAGCSGSSGGQGPTGPSGTSCTIVEGDAGATVTCTDGTSVTIPSGTNGKNGMNGMNAPDGGSCALTRNGDAGSYTLDCGGDAGTITVVPAVADYATMTADEKAQAAMTASITKVSFPADGRPVVSIKVTERHGWGVKDLSTTAVTWRLSLLKLVPGIFGSITSTPALRWMQITRDRGRNATSRSIFCGLSLS